MLLFRRVQGHMRATKSGSRPRYKNFAGQEADEADDEEDGSRRAGAGCCRSLRSAARPLIPVVVILIIVSIIAIRTANCDQDNNTTTTTIDGNSPTTNASASSASGTDSLRVAALATKLEHWFVCRRPVVHELGASQPPPESQSPSLDRQAGSRRAHHCQAHYDGHLCWPATPAGESAKLACPRLNWLSAGSSGSEQHQEDKSVIPSSIQTQAAAAAAAQANTSSTLESIKPPARLASSDIIHNGGAKTIRAHNNNNKQQHQLQAETEKFAYRKCVANQKRDLIADSLTAATQSTPVLAEWQPEADYSECHSPHDAVPGTNSGIFDPTDEWINLDQEADKRLFSSLVDELDRFEASIDPYSDPDLQEQWSLCIGNIMRHQRQQQQQATNSGVIVGSAGDLWCPIIFDGWRCWPSTRASEIAYVNCPSNQPGFSAERNAHKICTSDGTWYRHPMTNRYWSNYTTCVDTVDLAFRTKILNLYVIGNLISLIALSASLIIFISFKSLNCTRVTIHKNLFLSFITNNLMWIIWYTYVVNDADLLQKNPIECQFWHILLHYFLVSNYFWMFCEGLYLHTLLVVAFVSEDKILKWFYLLGWLTPVPIIVAYAYNRSFDDYYTSYCWMEESPYNLILMAPIGISLLLNLVFLINIVRVLVTKLRANNSPDTHQTRKAVRATLILIPLLGLHYILTPFRPEAKSEWEGIYESVAAVCTSFQGLCVAMLFCFCNGEVINVIKKKLKDTFNLSHSRRGGGSASECMRNRSNTTCTSIGFIGPGFNGSSGALQGSSELARSAAAASASLASNHLPCKLFQNRHSLSSTTTNITHVNGANGNADNCSSLLTTITTAIVQPNNIESSPLLLASSITTTADNLQSSCIQANIVPPLEPSLVSCQQLNSASIGCHGQGRKPGEEESVKLLQIDPEQTDCSVTTSFSIPM